MSKKRQNLSVTYNKKSKEWKVKKNGRILDVYSTKSKTVRKAVEVGRAIKEEGGKAELTIHNVDGTISKDKRTYGKDPRNIRG